MGTQDIFNSKSLKSFIKGSLVLIGFIFVLSCGVAVILFPFDQKIEVNKNVKVSKNSDFEKNIEIKKFEIGKNTDNKVNELIQVLIIPLIVFLVFLFILIFIFSCLLVPYNDSPSNNYEDIITQMKKIGETLIDIKKIEDSILNTQESQKDEEILIKNEKIRVIGEACLIIARAIEPDSGKNGEALKDLIAMLNQFSELFSEEK